MDGMIGKKLEGTNVKIWTAFTAVLVVLSLSLAPAAVAQDSVVEGYNKGGGGSQGQAEKGESAAGGSNTAAEDPGTTSTAQAGTLPFTGLDVGLVAFGGLVLIAAGAGIAFLARPRNA